MMIDAWDLASFVCKIFIYSCTVAAVGGVLNRLLIFTPELRLAFPFRRYLLFAACFGIFFAALNFFVQVGAFVDSGLSGMVDVDMSLLLVSTSVGTAMCAQLLGFIFIGISAISLFHSSLVVMVRIIALAGSSILLFSFTQVGHLVDKGLVARSIVPVHVLMVSFWLGSLLPLWFAVQFAASETGERKSLYEVMVRFSKVATIVVALLVISGSFLIFQLLQQWQQLFDTAYGLGLLLKLAVVALLLCLAAYNKWALVPALQKSPYTKNLGVSIACEIVLGCIAIIITATLTTLIGFSPTS